MPAFPAPKQFPGVSSLPPLVQELLQRAFPPDQLPMAPASMIYRGPGDIARVLGSRTQIPPAPKTGEAVSGAVNAYLKTIQQLLAIPGKTSGKQ